MNRALDGIAELRTEEKRLAAEIIKVQERIHELECQAAGIKIGDVVLYKGAEHMVTKVETWAKPPWATGLSKNKDGSWSKREVRMYNDWRKL